VAVVVIDPLPPAGGASFGNAGLLSPDTAVPIALPGMLRKVSGWLTDPLGPLSVRPSYFPRALPWLLRWIESGRLQRVLAISDAMRALHRETLSCWQELLGASLYRELIRPVGQVHVWEGEGDSANAQVEQQVRERHGIRTQMLTADDLRQMFPGIARDVTRGLLTPGNGFTVSPGRSVRTLGELFQHEGGELINERAMKLIPREGGGWMVMTNIANRSADHVVIAAGAWSRTLLDPLGIRVPLETERGYHAMLFDPEVMPALPISNKTRAFGVTPMEDGLRVAGTVEIAGLDAPPNEQRAEALVRHARRMFPALSGTQVRYWMGFRPSTPDSLPLLGPAPGRPGLHFVFGHGHFGMTGGPPSGRLVARLITGEPPGLDPAPYAAQRFR
jgi:D-amino-acid dehydrogenase